MVYLQRRTTWCSGKGTRAGWMAQSYSSGQGEGHLGGDVHPIFRIHPVSKGRYGSATDDQPGGSCH